MPPSIVKFCATSEYFVEGRKGKADRHRPENKVLIMISMLHCYIAQGNSDCQTGIGKIALLEEKKKDLNQLTHP